MPHYHAKKKPRMASAHKCKFFYEMCMFSAHFDIFGLFRTFFRGYAQLLWFLFLMQSHLLV